MNLQIWGVWEHTGYDNTSITVISGSKFRWIMIQTNKIIWAFDCSWLFCSEMGQTIAQGSSHRGWIITKKYGIQKPATKKWSQIVIISHKKNWSVSWSFLLLWDFMSKSSYLERNRSLDVRTYHPMKSSMPNWAASLSWLESVRGSYHGESTVIPIKPFCSSCSRCAPQNCKLQDGLQHMSSLIQQSNSLEFCWYWAISWRGFGV